jgi:hypothetical protein
MAFSALAYIRAASSIASCETPVNFTALLISFFETAFLNVSNFSVLFSINFSSWSFSLMITLIMALIRAVSVPGWRFKKVWAFLASHILRVSATINVLPLRSAFFISSPIMGCDSVTFAPILRFLQLN